MIYFVGEKRSEQAIKNNWHWEDNVSTAKYLLDCLHIVGIEKEDIIFRNLWYDDGTINQVVVLELRNTAKPIVGMGAIVGNELTRLGIEHYSIIHPAARGKIRKKTRYIEHLKDKLGWLVAVEQVMKEHEGAWKELAGL